MLVKLITSIICLVCLNVIVFAQINGGEIKITAPVKWERYKIGENNLSLIFPKMPVRVDSSDNCRNRDTKKYGVYNDGIVYIFTIISKSKEKPREYCEVKEEFNESTFEKHLSEIKQDSKNEVKETEVKINKSKAIKLSFQSLDGKWKYYKWLINDYKNKAIYDFAVANTDETKKDVKDFVESLSIGKNQSGIEIGEGSPFVIGDETVNTNTEKSEKSKTKELTIYLKPLPGYTEIARRNLTSGTVRLRVTFNANGSINLAEVIKSLPDGLTEQAIAAVKKIVFIPKTVDGQSMTVTKVVEFSFTIY